MVCQLLNLQREMREVMRARTLARRFRWNVHQLKDSWVFHPQTQGDRNARLLYLNTASVGFAMGGIMAFLSIFLVRLGASPAQVSWLSSAPALISIVSLIPGAMVAERDPDQVRGRSRYAKIV